MVSEILNFLKTGHFHSPVFKFCQCFSSVCPKVCPKTRRRRSREFVMDCAVLVVVLIVVNVIQIDGQQESSWPFITTTPRSTGISGSDEENVLDSDTFGDFKSVRNKDFIQYLDQSGSGIGGSKIRWDGRNVTQSGILGLDGQMLQEVVNKDNVTFYQRLDLFGPKLWSNHSIHNPL